VPTDLFSHQPAASFFATWEYARSRTSFQDCQDFKAPERIVRLLQQDLHILARTERFFYRVEYPPHPDSNAEAPDLQIDNAEDVIGPP
jgi:hypothetical protein